VELSRLYSSRQFLVPGKKEDKPMKIPVNKMWEMEHPEWKKHWAAHEQEACLPKCLVCESIEEARHEPTVAGYIKER
jgi:hypothetical protein